MVCVMAVFLIGSGTPTPTAEVTPSFDWAYRAGDYVRGTPAVSGQVVYVGSDDNNLHAVSTETGEGIRKFGTAGNVTSQPVIAGDAIYFGSWDGAIHALRASTGKTVWQYVTGGWVTAPPVLANDVLYIGSNDGSLYALGAADGHPIWRLSYPRPYSDTVNAAAAEFNVDPLLIWAVMREESRFDPEAVSWVGARGLMQIMPTTQTGIAERLGENIPPGDAFTPQANIRMGASYLSLMTDYFKGDLELAIMAYNGGAASVESWLEDPRVTNRDDLLRWIGFGETREYLERVSLSYRVYQELYAGGAGTASIR